MIMPLTPPKIVVATRNAGKLAEIQALLADWSIEWHSLSEFPHAPEAPELADTYLENAREKAELIAAHTGCWALADDSGLEVEALGWRPGVRSARFAGDQATDEENIRKVLQELKTQPQAGRRAVFRCSIVLQSPEGKERSSEGELWGEIADQVLGEKGFGYDPIFFLPERGKTLAQMEPDEKNSLSHRTQALLRLRESLSAHPVWGPTGR